MNKIPTKEEMAENRRYILVVALLPMFFMFLNAGLWESHGDLRFLFKTAVIVVLGAVIIGLKLHRYIARHAADKAGILIFAIFMSLGYVAFAVDAANGFVGEPEIILVEKKVESLDSRRHRRRRRYRNNATLTKTQNAHENLSFGTGNEYAQLGSTSTFKYYVGRLGGRVVTEVSYQTQTNKECIIRHAGLRDKRECTDL